MLTRILLAMLLLGAFPLSAHALATPIVRAQPTIIPTGGPVMLDLYFDPNGIADVTGFNVIFSVSSPLDLSIDLIANSGSLPIDCSPVAGGSSFDAQCTSSILDTEVLFGVMTVTGLLAGGELRLDSTSSYLIDVTNFGLPSAVLANVVVPEPGGLALLALPLLLARLAYAHSRA